MCLDLRVKNYGSQKSRTLVPIDPKTQRKIFEASTSLFYFPLVLPSDIANMFHITITRGDSKDTHNYTLNHKQVNQMLFAAGIQTPISSDSLETKQNQQLDDEELSPAKRKMSTETVTYFEEELQEETCKLKRSVQETAALKSRYGMTPSFQEWGNDDTEFYCCGEDSLPKYIGA